MADGRAMRRFVAACAVAALVGACSNGETATPTASGEPVDETVPTLYWLDIMANEVHRATGPAFDEQGVVVTETDTAPDGVAVDADGGKIYWTSMGTHVDMSGQVVAGGGTLQRANLDGSNVERILEPGVTLVPKQLQLDSEHGHLYWADREGAKIWRAGLDGSNPEILVSDHGNVELVGLALDVPAGFLYFGDRITKKIFRAALQMPEGQTAASRTDIELLVEYTGAAMPIDLDVDAQNGYLYWTDRFAGTVQRAELNLPAGQTAATRADVETLVDGLLEPIGLSLDVPNDKMYYTVFSGAVYEAGLDGKEPRKVARSTSASGVELAHVPAARP